MERTFRSNTLNLFFGSLVLLHGSLSSGNPANVPSTGPARREIVGREAEQVYSALRAFNHDRVGSWKLNRCHVTMDASTLTVKIHDPAAKTVQEPFGQAVAMAQHGADYYGAYGITTIYLETSSGQPKYVFRTGKLTWDTDEKDVHEETTTVFTLANDETSIQSISILKSETTIVRTPTGKISDFKKDDWTKSAKKTTSKRTLQAGQCDFPVSSTR
jgi:hypothetical protein